MFVRMCTSQAVNYSRQHSRLLLAASLALRLDLSS
jgi:hypothetical protein